MTIITRFAPSPTGLLHVGNMRTAIVNYLFTKKMGGKFMLRMDDTDLVRSKEEYAENIQTDLKWMGFEWDIFAKQSDHIARYEEIKKLLLEKGRLYPCYESQEELDMKRKFQMNRGLPPIYDRASLKLTDKQKADFEAKGVKPHYRFLINDEKIAWNDLVRGETVFEGKHISDPILIREDGTMTYILSSVVDDIDFKISHIIRGEDHVSNTAVQIQIFNSLGATSPTFAHLALIKSKDDEGISKRTGGFDIKSLREEGIEAMTISSLLSKIGSSMNIEARSHMKDLIAEFDLTKFGRAPTSYDKEDLKKLNKKIIALYEYNEVKPRLDVIEMSEVDKDLWDAARHNIDTIFDIKDWFHICKQEVTPIITDEAILPIALKHLPEGNWDNTTWDQWIGNIQANSEYKGKQLFMPIRQALTAMSKGPELRSLLPLIGRERVVQRLMGQAG